MSFDEPTRTEGLKIDHYWKDEWIDDKDGLTWSAGYWIDGATYFDAESAIQGGILGFCGCGMPEVSLAYLRDALQTILTEQESHFTVHPPGPYHSEGEKYVIWYLLDKLHLTEHGGSVPGWLTDEGRDVLHDLNILYPPGSDAEEGEP